MSEPTEVEVISCDEADELLNEWFQSVLFVDGPEEDLPELEPEDDDEPDE